MSGVYIRGMEMPKNCTDCDFRKKAAHEYLSDCLLCPFTGNVTPYTKRDVTCPLIPVPDHGRLIDADALDADLEKQDMKTGEWDAIGFSISEIDNAPTIIPCDKGE